MNVPGITSSLMFSSFGVKPPASGFYSYSSLKTSHPNSTYDKTSTLMVKQFSTVRDNKRGSQSYMEKRRGRRDRGDREEKRRGQMVREQSTQ